MDGDGCWGTFTYSSKRYLLAVDFQSIAHIAGYRTTGISTSKCFNRYGERDQYKVSLITKSKKYTYVQDSCIEKSDIDEVWCVNTSNGTIVTRDKNCISISGNCRAMWMMLQHHEPDDFVIATGQKHSVRDFAKAAFEHIDRNYEDYVKIDPKYYRPSEVDALQGDPRKAKEVLGWEPEISFDELIYDMMQNDLKIAWDEMQLNKAREREERKRKWKLRRKK